MQCSCISNIELQKHYPCVFVIVAWTKLLVVVWDSPGSRWQCTNCRRDRRWFRVSLWWALHRLSMCCLYVLKWIQSKKRIVIYCRYIYIILCSNICEYICLEQVLNTQIFATTLIWSTTVIFFWLNLSCSDTDCIDTWILDWYVSDWR